MQLSVSSVTCAPTFDAVWVAECSNHLVVVLISATKGCFGADGSNELFDAQFRQDLEARMKTKITPLKFSQQRHQDHCASSAVSLVIEFMRLSQSIEPIGSTIRVEPWTLDRIRSMVHKESSVPLPTERSNIANLEFKRCPKCDKQFKVRKVLVAHARKCPGKWGF
jgi:hypothetical protein